MDHTYTAENGTVYRTGCLPPKHTDKLRLYGTEAAHKVYSRGELANLEAAGKNSQIGRAHV